jgi:hypothetical protein
LCDYALERERERASEKIDIDRVGTLSVALFLDMLGGAVGLPPSSAAASGGHKSSPYGHRPSPHDVTSSPASIDLETWRDTFLQQANRHKNVSEMQLQGVP